MKKLNVKNQLTRAKLKVVFAGGPIDEPAPGEGEPTGETCGTGGKRCYDYERCCQHPAGFTYCNTRPCGE
ncbi:hypothetical protein SAMN02787100_0428 [Chryseobacterium sp. OV279]|nr:hypothetical protein SAMN02787100_0428 [Chryseobacterium sp. OV279]